MAHTKAGLRSLAHEISETPPQRMIEKQIKKVPADTFIAAAAVSVGLSLMLRFIGRKSDSEFVGQWAPTMLALAIYDKLAKGGGEEARSFPGA